MWCYKVLPLVYDESLSYYEILCKVVKYINNLIDQDKIIGNELNDLKKNLTLLINGLMILTLVILKNCNPILINNDIC